MEGTENTRVAEFAAMLRRHNNIDHQYAACVGLIEAAAAYRGDPAAQLTEIRDVLAALREVTSCGLGGGA